MARGRMVFLTLALMFAPSLFASHDDSANRPFPDDFPEFLVPPQAVAWNGPTGERLLAGALANHGPFYSMAVVKVATDGTPDRSFGDGGIVRLPVWGAAEWAYQVDVQRDGRIVVAGEAIDPSSVGPCYWAFCARYTALFRLNADGSRDRSFNGSGSIVLRFGASPLGEEEAISQPSAFSILANGSIALRGPAPASSALMEYGYVLPDGNVQEGPAFVPKPRQATFRVAVSFFNRALDRFFATADADEIASLDRREATGWQWAGSGFRVWAAGTPGKHAVCRFYGRPDAGLDSHVLTASEEECALLAAAGTGWMLESANVFGVDLPDARTGACAASARPVYRLWNGRSDGGHHLTTDRVERNRLVVAGYVPEGWGPEGVAMCSADMID